MANQSRISLVFFWLLISIFRDGEAIEYKPWAGNFLEFEFRSTALYQHYQSIASQSRLHAHSADDLFLTFSLGNVYNQFAIELEGTFAETHRQRGCVDNLRLHGRYIWMDDIAGDDFSFTTGAILSQAFLPALHDISSFHHARGEAEIYATVGKEQSCGTIWLSRWWVLGGIGTGLEQGAPWLKANIEYESRLSADGEWGVFVKSLWGLGNRRLCPHHFHGYGSVQHQSVDIGLRYRYLLKYMGSLTAEYTYRPYARNFPAYSHCFLVTWLYTFGL